MALLLDLLRHGEAVPAGAGDDRGRGLTMAGEQRLRALAARLATGPAPDRAFASPRLRAARTARIVLEPWRPELAIETLLELEPDAEPSRMVAALEERHVTAGHALLVGHLPLLDRLCVLLVGQPVGFAAGSLRRVEFDGAVLPGRGRLLERFDS